jgi:hypothetical protein
VLLTPTGPAPAIQVLVDNLPPEVNPTGLFVSGTLETFLVPEPATWASFLLGMAVLTGLRRRRRG